MAVSAGQWEHFGLRTGVTAAEVALWVEATLGDDSAPVYLGMDNSVEAAGEKGWYSWGWDAWHLVVDAAAAVEASQAPVIENRHTVQHNGKKTSVVTAHNQPTT